MRPQSRGADTSECCCRPPSELKKGAGNAVGMPGAGRPHGPPAKEKAGGSYHRFSQKHPAIPAGWFDDLLRTLPGEPGLFAPSSRDHLSRLDTSVGVSGPYDLVVRLGAVRPHEGIARGAKASIASPPHVLVTSARPSLFHSRRDAGRGPYFSEKQKMNIFGARTRQSNRP
jgi:hypothetical protein